MKHLLYTCTFISIIAISLVSCKRYLEKPLVSSTVTEDDIFSSRINAQTFLWQTYREAIHYGWPLYNASWTQRLRRSILAGFCDECNFAIGASAATRTNIAGYTPDNRDNRPDIFEANWDGIRRAWLFIEHIDNVPDIPSVEKEQMKAEAKTLIALRYLYMMGMYGGVPIVTNSLSVEDDLTIPRASIEDMVNFIVGLSDEAAGVLPNDYPPEWKGRVTKGVALAVKARTLLYAASPLYNTNQPILNFGENARMISYASYDKNRWQMAANANKAVIDWATEAGCHIINTGNPFDDFGRAVSEPDNPEVIFSYQAKVNQHGWTQFYLPLTTSTSATEQGNSITFNILPMFYKADGTDQEWPKLGDAPRPFSEYTQKMEEMEPRFKQTAWAWGRSAWTNPDLPLFKWGFGQQDGQNPDLAGPAKLVKFTYQYRGGTDRNYSPDWIIFRLAEFYLNYAEAVNEFTPNDQKAYDALNVIRSRAGLPLINPGDTRYNTQETLRELIWRERAVELFAEEHRIFDVRRWRIAERPGIIGGPFYGFRYTRNAARTGYLDYEVFLIEDRTWRDRMYFAPFDQEEVNKGLLTQNPGY